MSHITRRGFIQDTTAIAAGIAAAPLATQAAAAPAPQKTSFTSQWQLANDRVWLGSEYWSNPLQDWRIAGGRIECVNPAANRNVHLLTRQLGEARGELTMSAVVGRIGGAWGDGKGSAGFRIGIRGPLDEYRNSLIFGSGLDAGVTADGRVFVGPLASAKAISIPESVESLRLDLASRPNGSQETVTLTVRDAKTNEVLGEASNERVPAARLVGNIALVANFPGPQQRRGQQPGAGTGKFWFADWTLEGDKLAAHEDRAFGPILFSQYTLHDGILKLTAQMPPIGDADAQTVRLLLKEGDDWKPAAAEPIHPQARTATFRIEDWDATRDVPYRLLYTEVQKTKANPGGTQPVSEWTGTIRRDPVDQPVLTVADISCNIHAAFPNHEYVAHVAKLEPVFMAFVGDQFYESSGGYGIVRTPLAPAIDDYLRKWFLHGWTWRELMRDRPSVSLPDDHDVYQGNVWGEAGAPQDGSTDEGGYLMHPEWVNVVHRTQASHHPDPYDPTPVLQNISVYYGPLTYGRISFAILADRQFKTGPAGVAPPTSGRADHVTDPNFDPRTADVEGAELLGERQIAFLREWAADWRGADMKAVLSQTIFTAMATTHGGPRERLVADYDTNGWPQTPRNEALREIRKAFAIHLAGDQHLPAVVHYGIDEHRDAGVAFAGPAINVGYPRWWEPDQPGSNRQPGQSELLGDFTDHFGNPMTVLAVKNGVDRPSGGHVLETMREKASGLGIARFNRQERTITLECWPYLADPQEEGTQFEGWPIVVKLEDNYARTPAAHLPTLSIEGIKNPVVQVVREADGEIVYTLRIGGQSFQPPVFATGTYTARISDPDANRMKELTGLKAAVNNDERLGVQV